MTIQSITTQRCYLIAELGANHQGSLVAALQMVDVAAEVGIDACKGQKRDTARMSGRDRPYDGPQSFGKTYGEHRDALELDITEHATIMKHAQALGLDYGLSVWDRVSAEEARAISVAWIKIPSACLTDHDLLRLVASYRMPLILSSGMSTSEEILHAAAIVADCGWWALLQCTSAYPCPVNAVDLHVMRTLRFNTDADCIGVSGHWNGIAIASAAVALGARIIERHVTLDRTLRGTDHAAALEPVGQRIWARDVRTIEQALGQAAKRVHPCEEAARRKLREMK